MTDSAKPYSPYNPTATLSDRVLRLVYVFEDLVFEKWHGLQLGGFIPAEQLVADKETSLSHSHPYQAGSCRTSRALFNEAKKTKIHFQNFIDIGSGKGKICFYAAKRLSIENIIGIEFSKPLVDLAETNRKKLGLDNITFLHADAVDYLLPKGNSLIFLFNSFDGVILERFIMNNITHFKENESVIAYANDSQIATLARCGFIAIFRNQTRKMSLWRYN